MLQVVAILTFHVISLLEYKSTGKISQGKCWMATINKERRPHTEEATIPSMCVFLLNTVSFSVILIVGAMPGFCFSYALLILELLMGKSWRR